jgi:hypothetical protein
MRQHLVHKLKAHFKQRVSYYLGQKAKGFIDLKEDIHVCFVLDRGVGCVNVCAH